MCGSQVLSIACVTHQPFDSIKRLGKKPKKKNQKKNQCGQAKTRAKHHGRKKKKRRSGQGPHMQMQVKGDEAHRGK